MSRLNAAKAKEACEVLDLDMEELDANAISEAYRSATKKAHPDAGGSAEAFGRVQWAKSTLEQWLKARTVARGPSGPVGSCRACAGKGYIQKMNGFNQGPRLWCVMCEGTGNVIKKDRDQ